MNHPLREPGSVLFHGTWQAGSDSLLLHDPLRTISGHDPAALPAALDDVERELAAGHIVAGFMCYEAGRAFGLQTHDPWALTPLYWFGVYRTATHPRPFGATPPHRGGVRQTTPIRDLPDTKTGKDAVYPSPRRRDAYQGRGRPEGPGVGAVPDMALNVTRDEYVAAIARIKDYIAAGDTYQVNYTCHARFAADLDPLDYFLAMVASHPVPYAAYLDIGEAQVLSISPELLLEKRGATLKTKPMKGTRKRGRTPAEDEALRAELMTSLKDRAENLMIVDMMRNDLGRICEVGSVAVPTLFEAEKYRSVWQMTTTVTGRLREEVGLAGVIAATLPGSSVTGAPKKRTMEIIHELEREPRGVYCGAVGLFLPDGSFTLNLPIRTLVHRDGQYDLGIGSGIVWDSDPLGEYDETILKSQFARRLSPELRLFETMLVSDDRTVAYEAEHLARLAQSAAYWNIPFDAAQARAALHAWVESHAGDALSVVRMELDQQGALHFTGRPLPPPPAPPVRVLISDARTDSADRLLYHKTSQRALYDSERDRAVRDGFFEVLFRNEAGNLTEGGISNLLVKLAGRWLTPPLMDGLLPGVWRADFMAQHGAIEERLTPEMLAGAEEVVIGNSVRGAVPVDEVVLAGQTLWRRPGGA
ncbi:MAG: aminodeoxychorismate synthase component I [Armatimonadetes bacterium]|nr:aminodeoxychorismate synthase component I [Armatimonadota bacterium]